MAASCVAFHHGDSDTAESVLGRGSFTTLTTSLYPGILSSLYVRLMKMIPIMDRELTKTGKEIGLTSGMFIALD